MFRLTSGSEIKSEVKKSKKKKGITPPTSFDNKPSSTRVRPTTNKGDEEVRPDFYLTGKLETTKGRVSDEFMVCIILVESGNRSPKTQKRRI